MQVSKVKMTIFGLKVSKLSKGFKTLGNYIFVLFETLYLCGFRIS